MIRTYAGTTTVEDIGVEVLVLISNDDPPHVATRLQGDTRWSAPLDLEEQS